MAYTGSRYTNSNDTEGDAGSSGNLFALTNILRLLFMMYYLRDASGNLVADPYFWW
jgi:hypothetical protein